MMSGGTNRTERSVGPAFGERIDGRESGPRGE